MITFIVLLNCILNDIAWDQASQWEKKKKQGSNRKNITWHFYFSVTDYVYTLVVKCDYILQQVHTPSCCNSLKNEYFLFNYQHLLVIFTPALLSYHFIHSWLRSHFTSNYWYTLKIACVDCKFACSYSMSHPFKLGEDRTYET